jgi:hypothetical protein
MQVEQTFDLFTNLKNVENRSDWLAQGVKFRTIF